MPERCLNLNIFKIGGIEHYGRREKARIHGKLEQQHDQKDDGKSRVLKMTEAMKLNLNPAVFNNCTDWKKQT